MRREGRFLYLSSYNHLGSTTQRIAIPHIVRYYRDETKTVVALSNHELFTCYEHPDEIDLEIQNWEINNEQPL